MKSQTSTQKSESETFFSEWMTTTTSIGLALIATDTNATDDTEIFDAQTVKMSIECEKLKISYLIVGKKRPESQKTKASSV